jgi:hypothetical protein
MQNASQTSPISPPPSTVGTNRFLHDFLAFEFGGGPFGDDGWAFQHVDEVSKSPKQFIIDLPSQRWRTDDRSECGLGLKNLRQRVCGTGL